MSTYKLIAKNQSDNNGTFAIFQQTPNVKGAENVFTLAWFTKYAYQGTEVDFTWHINYNFVWDRCGLLKPGIHFKASQHLAADPEKGSNQITLNYDAENDAFNFEDESTEPSAFGSLLVKTTKKVPQSKNLPNHAAAVGIGMDGKGSFVVQTQPNMLIKFEPHPTYYLIFGNYRQGEVLNVETILGQALKIEYDRVFTRTATLDKNNEWTLT